jgi:hypothetical protein
MRGGPDADYAGDRRGQLGGDRIERRRVMVTIEEVRAAVERTPFVAFTVRLANGWSVTVRRPDLCHVSTLPMGRLVTIREDFQTYPVDVGNIESIETAAPGTTSSFRAIRRSMRRSER